MSQRYRLYLSWGPMLALGAADLVDGIVDQLDRMELVEGDFSFGKVFRDALYVGAAHVAAYFLDAGRIGVVIVDVIREPSNSRRIVAFGDVDDFPGVHVDEQRDVVLTALGRGFIDGDAPQLGEVHARHRRIDVMLNDTPQTRVVLANEAGSSGDRHILPRFSPIP